MMPSNVWSQQLSRIETVPWACKISVYCNLSVFYIIGIKLNFHFLCWLHWYYTEKRNVSTVHSLLCLSLFYMQSILHLCRYWWMCGSVSLSRECFLHQHTWILHMWMQHRIQWGWNDVQWWVLKYVLVFTIRRNAPVLSSNPVLVVWSTYLLTINAMSRIAMVCDIAPAISVYQLTL